MPKLTYSRKLGEEIIIGDAVLTFVAIRNGRITFTVEADDPPCRERDRDARRNLGRTWPPPVSGE